MLKRVQTYGIFACIIMTFMMEISTGNFHLGFGIGTILAIISVDRVIALFNNLFMEKMNKAVFDYFKQ